MPIEGANRSTSAKRNERDTDRPTDRWKAIQCPAFPYVRTTHLSPALGVGLLACLSTIESFGSGSKDGNCIQYYCYRYYIACIASDRARACFAGWSRCAFCLSSPNSAHRVVVVSCDFEMQYVYVLVNEPASRRAICEPYPIGRFDLIPPTSESPPASENNQSPTCSQDFISTPWKRTFHRVCAGQRRTKTSMVRELALRLSEASIACIGRPEEPLVHNNPKIPLKAILFTSDTPRTTVL